MTNVVDKFKSVLEILQGSKNQECAINLKYHLIVNINRNLNGSAKPNYYEYAATVSDKFAPIRGKKFDENKNLFYNFKLNSFEKAMKCHNDGTKVCKIYEVEYNKAQIKYYKNQTQLCNDAELFRKCMYDGLAIDNLAEISAENKEVILENLNAILSHSLSQDHNLAALTIYSYYCQKYDKLFAKKGSITVRKDGRVIAKLSSEYPDMWQSISCEFATNIFAFLKNY